MKRPLLWLPLIGFALLLIVVAAGLFRPADRTVRSALVGQPLPPFALPAMLPGKPGVASASGGARLVNVFASWCVPCIAEAPQLLALKQAGVPIDGVAVRDTPDAVRGFLARNGDPYARIGSDPASGVQLALGSAGVPESFVVDARGKIVLQHVGAINPDDVPVIVAAVEAAR